MKAVIQTNKGAINLKLFDDAPLTVASFAFLAKKGYYNGLKFHRVIADFMIQGPAEHGIPGMVNLYGIESPGLTSSMAIGDYVAELLKL